MESRAFADNTEEERIEIFKDFFDRDLETYFSSSICCCDQCFDDFSSIWPGTASRDIEMQQGGIELRTFLANSRMQDNFSQEEITEYSKHLSCPNCSNQLKGVFWIYEHRFSVPKTFDLQEIAALARRSPFLLLSHPFARQVFDTIVSMGEVIPKTPARRPLYRARRAAGLAEPRLKDFGPPPRHLVEEGRYNHAGHSMLYLAETEQTAFAEIALEKERCHVAAVDLNINLKVLDLDLTADVETEAQEIIQCLARSALCAAPRIGVGWDRKEYVFSRFVADCARHAGFDAIRFGSTRDHGMNLVLLEPPDELLRQAVLLGIRTLPIA